MDKFTLAAISSGLSLTFLLSTVAEAGSATWELNPGSGDWNTAANWTPMTVPNGSADTATFAFSNTANVSISANTEVNGITFASAATNPYTITASPGVTLTVSGAGVTNNSGTTQNFVAAPDGGIVFLNSATAGNAGIESSGDMQFLNNSTAGSARIFTDRLAQFLNSSTAANATILNQGHLGFSDNSTAASASILNLFPSSMSFSDSSTAANATIVCEDHTEVNFFDSSSAGNANIFSAGVINFSGSSQGGTARMGVTSDRGILFAGIFIGHNVTVGSIESDGFLSLGASNLTVGSNNLSTMFSGVISDFGGGSVTKIGTGTLELTEASTYTGGTTISAGTLLIDNTTGSGTGTGAVKVTAGTLGGYGTIAGAVTVGTGNGGGALISPGVSPGTLTIQSTLTLNSDAIYRFELNSTTPVADKLVANGVTLNGAAFLFTDLGRGKLALGTTFVLIDNTSNSAISGAFSNLADNSGFSNNGNTYEVSYEGGTGNDLTLTVVPEPSVWVMFGLGFAMVGALMRLQLARGRKR